jgi:hypothetical protein
MHSSNLHPYVIGSKDIYIEIPKANLQIFNSLENQILSRFPKNCRSSKSTYMDELQFLWYAVQN